MVANHRFTKAEGLKDASRKATVYLPRLLWRLRHVVRVSV